MSPWPEVLASTVERWSRQAGIDPALSAPWLALAVANGPTPASGPLSFDLLPPLPWVPGRWGINVFSRGVLAVARDWASEHLHGDAVVALEALADTGATWVGGFVAHDRGPRLKLYAVRGHEGLVPEAWEGRPVQAVGVDVTSAGAERWRAYTGADAALLLGRPALPFVRRAGVDRRIVTLAADPAGKRTQNWIFGPEATVADLIGLAASLDLPHVVAAARSLPPVVGPWRIAPVALEWDLPGRGPPSADVLMTLVGP